MTSLTIGVLSESPSGEKRVSIDPDAVKALLKKDFVVKVESGAGLAATFADSAYEKAGALIASRTDVLTSCDVLAVVRPPDAETVAALHSSQLLIGLLDPQNNPDLVKELAAKGVTAVAFELLPRTLSRAQSMDALSSQASTAGYRAALVAAEAFGRYLPMMITASGTARPANLIVIGAGVAGLQAIGTARRLGAVVTGYDVRPDSRGEVESLGAQFQTSSVAEGAGEGGYARAMTTEEQASQAAELSKSLKAFDIIITTAKVPGRKPPMLVTEETLSLLKPGSVCVDLAASANGGNVWGSVDGKHTVTENGVIVIGAGELASDLPTSSSSMYARNVTALLGSLVTDGAVVVDPADEVHAAVVVTHAGEVVSGAVRRALGLDPPPTDPPTQPDSPVHAGAIDRQVQPA